MNKTELIDLIAAENNLQKKTVGIVLNATFEAIKEALSEGDKVLLVDFGTFTPRKRNARKCRNPKTGEEIEVPDAIVASFSAGKALKESMQVAQR